jgi:hypothetical protein
MKVEEALKTKDSKEKAKKDEEKAKKGEEKVASEAPDKLAKESSSPIVVNLQTEILPPNPCMCDACFVGLSMSRLTLKDSSIDTV